MPDNRRPEAGHTPSLELPPVEALPAVLPPDEWWADTEQLRTLTERHFGSGSGRWTVEVDRVFGAKRRWAGYTVTITTLLWPAVAAPQVPCPWPVGALLHVFDTARGTVVQDFMIPNDRLPLTPEAMVELAHAALLSHADWPGGTVSVRRALGHAWRLRVTIPGHAAFLETIWTPSGRQDSAQTPLRVVEHRTSWGNPAEDKALQGARILLNEVTSGGGRHALEDDPYSGFPETVIKAMGYKQKNPRLTWDRIARSCLSMEPSTLRKHRARYKKVHGTEKT